jgi:HAD superfamily hydrolase (TIGR01450 family)
MDDLLGRYDGFLLDAYGVLVDKRSALPGAERLLQRLDAAGRPWLVVTNAASRLPETLTAVFAELGLTIAPEHILTSGMLLADHFTMAGLAGRRCVVIGPDESRRYAERAGGRVVELGEDTDAEVLILADQRQEQLLEEMDLAASLMLRRLDADPPKPLALVLCNPDLLYPVRPGRFGFTAGGLAAMLEAVLAERLAGRNLGFVRLGKPNRPIFDAARARLGARRPLMIGDQLGTDIAGAAGAGLDSLLVGSGLAPRGGPATWRPRPTWYLPSLARL